MGSKWTGLIKKETVFVISGLAAMLSAFFVPPSLSYKGYIDFKVIALLFSLMVVVAGLQKIGTFEILSQALLKKARCVRIVSLILVTLCFFIAMMVTNDVALLTMVPFTLAALDFLSEKRLIFIVVMETVAANLGSMLTPVGNPQNLYLFSYFHLTAVEFLKITFPITLLSFILVVIMTSVVRGQKLNIVFDVETMVESKFKLCSYIGLFFICIASVVGILDYRLMFIIVLLSIIVLDWKLLKEVDYFLLITFIFFFIFVGNAGKMDIISQEISQMIQGKVFFSAIMLSQFISNVPAAVMLSSFTDNYRDLILGTDVGGLGTLIASLASLISFKIYSQRKSADKGRYLIVFTAINFLYLIILIFASTIL